MSTQKDHSTPKENKDPLLHPKINAISICPVCKNPIHETNAVDTKSIVEDNLYYVGGVLIKDCPVRLYCDFEHCYAEEGVTLDEPHDLVAVVEAVFDTKGNCTRFTIVEIHEKH